MKVKFIALFFMVCFTSCFSENKDIFSIKDTKKNIEFSLNDSRAKIEELYHITETNQDVVSTKGLEIYFINKRILSIDIQSSCYKLSGNISVGSSIKKLYKIYNRQPDFAGKFDDESFFYDYYYPLRTESPWKEPQNVLRFIYQDEKIKEIVLFYTE